MVSDNKARKQSSSVSQRVLILVVMEDGLRPNKDGEVLWNCLNPCCNGRWSQTNKDEVTCIVMVLILVVMEDGLRHFKLIISNLLMSLRVLILVVMEDGLRLPFFICMILTLKS